MGLKLDKGVGDGKGLDVEKGTGGGKGLERDKDRERIEGKYIGRW